MTRKFLSALLVLVLSFGTATSAWAAEKQAEKAQQQFAEEVAKLQPYIQFDADGFFQLNARTAKEVGISQQTFTAVKMQFAKINGELRKLTKEARLDMFKTGKEATNGGATTQSVFCTWLYVPRWELEAFAWFVIIAGGVSATLGLFATGTILGAPAGAVLGALGIWLGMTGSALLWYADTYYTPTSVYVCWVS